MVVTKCISKCTRVADCDNHQPMCKMFVSSRTEPYCALNRKKYALDKNQKCKLIKKKSIVKKNISRLHNISIKKTNPVKKTNPIEKTNPINKPTFPIQITHASNIQYIWNGSNQYILSYSRSKTAVFKTGSGNLLYEYFAGLFINDYINRFPCFICTHALLYYHKTDNEWSKIISNQELTRNDIMESFYVVDDVLNGDIISRACSFETKAALIQDYTPNGLSLDNITDYHHRLHSLFQVYAPLESMRRNNQFYMFDILNTNAIQIYQLSKPIYFVYQLTNGGFVSFECSYMAKIINYSNTLYPQTEMIQRMLCSDLSCSPSCGSSSGFKQFTKTDTISTRERRLLSKYINYDISTTQNIVELLAKLIGITYTIDNHAISKYNPDHVCHITL